MPQYDYYCDKCKETFTKIKKYDEKDSVVCETCNSIATILISPTSFILKGVCWSSDNYMNKN